MEVVTAIIAIGVLIVVHEAGHYVVARLCGMRVERFSVGFGPAILGWRSKKTGTLFQLGPIPFGGFVEIKGMNILEEVDPSDATAYPNRPVWQRFVTIFAGPATNYLFAVVLAFVLFASAGMRVSGPFDTVASTAPGFDAHGKLEPGDRIVSVDGQPLDRHLGEYLAKKDKDDPTVTLGIERSGEQLEIELTPTWDPELEINRIGIAFETRQDVGIGTAATEAIAYPVVMTKTILVGLYEWATGEQEGRVSSVVGITAEVAKAVEQGWVDALALLMLLNVYLGLFNLFPLPALDGGRLVFLGYEMVTRRRANPKLEATIHMIGVLLLAVLIVVVTVNDCRHL